MKDFNQISALLRNPSWDIIVVFVFIALGFFYGIFAGKSKLVSLLFSLYVSGFLFENFYYLNKLAGGRGVFEEFLIKAAVFVVLAAILTFLFSKSLSGDYSSTRKNWWKSLLLSFACAGLLLSYIFHFFPAREIFTFSPLIQNLFASNAAFFWWLIIPFIALFLAKR